MKILHINTRDSGGASKACLRLHLGLLQEGIDSNVLLLSQSNKTIQKSFKFIPPLPLYSKSEKLKRKAKRILREIYLYHPPEEVNIEEVVLKNRPEGLGIFSFPDTPFDITQYPLYLESDIINLHWTAGFLDYSSFFKNNSKKIIWTLHDMNPFTGGCHYAGMCDGFQKSCLKCPQLLNTQDDNYSNKILQIKLNAIESKTNLTIVPISNWLLQQSMKSVLFNQFKHVQIPNGINQNIFKTIPKNTSREILGLPSDKKIILFVSDFLNTKRKGFYLLLKAIEQFVGRDDVLLCAAGDTTGNEIKGRNVFELGSISDERLMSVVYSSADVFVIPSLEDNFPNTILESLMCGIPVIGFPIGGIKEMIHNNENGYLCDSISVASLVETLTIFLKNSNIFNRENIRKNALELYSQKVQAIKYIELYDEILKNINPKSFIKK